MLQYRSFQEIVDHSGLRIVMVQGMPSPWAQAAKPFLKSRAWNMWPRRGCLEKPTTKSRSGGGEASAPIVAWATERPINRWMDILYLSEGLAPKPSMIPRDATQRALMIGLSNEICGPLGIGWNRRLQLLRRCSRRGTHHRKSREWAANMDTTRRMQKRLGSAPLNP
jgi:hypothetical protein